MSDERALVFDCNGESLVGILHASEAAPRRGVVIVVGGPQYRVGSHRQFVLLARFLASQGVPVLRFDYRGMGDAEGAPRTFESIGDDIGAAVDALLAADTRVSEVVLWGLCDAAAAIGMYAHKDPRVAGLVLLNPWVRTEAGSADAMLRGYYVRKVFDPAFWRKLLSGRVRIGPSIKSFLGKVATVLRSRRARGRDRAASGENGVEGGSLPDRLLAGLRRFSKPVLVVLSGHDLTADEFRALLQRDERWREMLAARAYTSLELADADHTFSTATWRDEVARATLDWLRRS